MIVGVKSVICTCGVVMRRTGGVFGGETTSDTYYCSNCQKYVIVLTPKEEEQEDFVHQLRRR